MDDVRRDQRERLAAFGMTPDEIEWWEKLAELAIVGIDLASTKQAAVVADHDSIILGRPTFDGDAWVIDDILDWALPIALEAGVSGVVVDTASPPGTAGSRSRTAAAAGASSWCT